MQHKLNCLVSAQMSNEYSALMPFSSGLILEGFPPIFYEIHIQNTTSVNYLRT